MLVKFSFDKKITLKDVTKHNTEKDCWMVIHDKVYDITKFIPDHPGGDTITLGCGEDATYYFENRPMGDMNFPHSQDARDMLKQFYVGDLKK